MSRDRSERRPAEPIAPVREPRITPYIIAILVGVPTTLLMAYLAYDRLFVALTLTLAAMSGLGTILAFIGMRSQPRRFRVTSLLLTLIPGIALIAAVALLVAILVAFVQAADS